jgi:uncharacterized small protein (DUF1192 family)
MLDKALKQLRPNAKWLIRNDDLEWYDTEQTQPTDEEIQAEIDRLEAEYEAKEYQRLREKEYPSYADQFDIIFHEGIDAWKAKIQEVKAKYPKPE